MSSTKIELLVSGLGFPECPRWFDDHLWLSDYHTKQLLKISADGLVSVVLENPERVGAVGFLPDGAYYVVSMEDRLVFHHAEGVTTEVADLSAVCPAWLNDSVVDPHGRVYVDDTIGMGADLTKIILVGLGIAPRVVATDMRGANGLVITPDGKTLIAAETFASRLTAFTITDDGSLEDRRLFADLGEEAPNGICLDAEGAVWVSSHHGRFLRVLPGGAIADVIEVPGGPQCMAVACMLGGEDRRQLFLCSADYSGQRMPDLFGANPKTGRVDVVTVDVPGAGWP
jgi:sugar lactone lactonase YvrE